MIHAILLLLSLSLFAQVSPEETLKKALSSNEECLVENEEEALGVTISSAIKSIHDGKLTFLGRLQLPGFNQNYSCIFKSNTAYIIYNHCMGSKKEYDTLDLEIVSFKGGINRFYLANNKSGLASQTVRSQYDSSWGLDFVATEPPGDLKAKDFVSFLKVKEEYPGLGSCYVGGTFKAKDMSQKSECNKHFKNPAGAEKWKEDADKIWKEPGEEFYSGLKVLRSAVTSSKY